MAAYFDSFCAVQGRTNSYPLIHCARCWGYSLGDRLCFVSSTDEQVEELSREIDDVLAAKVFTRSDGERLRGRLQFASSQIFGKRFKRLLKALPHNGTHTRKVLCALQISPICSAKMLLVGYVHHSQRYCTNMWMRRLIVLPIVASAGLSSTWHGNNCSSSAPKWKRK